MLLSCAGSSIELVISGYEFADPGQDDGTDLDWLIVHGTVRDGTTRWAFRDACLTTDEAVDLGRWLADAAGRPVRELRFVEPELAFAAVGRAPGSAVSITATFACSAAPPGMADAATTGHVVTVEVSAEVLARAACEWLAECVEFRSRS